MSLLVAPPTYRPSVRGDAMLLTHGRKGTERLIGAALLLDAILGGHLDVPAGCRNVVAGLQDDDAPTLLADLRDRVLDAPAASTRTWIDRAAVFAPTRTAAELISAGLAAPLAQRLQRTFTLSVEARVEYAARGRLACGGDPRSIALAAALHVHGGFGALAFPPPVHTLPTAAQAVIGALR